VTVPPLSFVPDRDEVVVLVDARDNAVGVAPKLDAHRNGRLHRAVSVVLFDDRSRLLLQRRAETKYHSGGLWSNTCCGHPRPGESIRDAAMRRLSDELGITGCDLNEVSVFVYRADLGGGLAEYELDHVVIGRWNGVATPNPTEVMETRWVEREQLLRALATTPGQYTAWTPDVVFRACWHEWQLPPGDSWVERPCGAPHVDRTRYSG
jgi:isopentenyl-diphosphate delta-isomerase